MEQQEKEEVQYVCDWSSNQDGGTGARLSLLDLSDKFLRSVEERKDVRLMAGADKLEAKSERETLDQLKSSSSQRDNLAGRRIEAMLNSGDKRQQEDARKLLEMASDPEKKELAVAIVVDIPTAQARSTFLDVLSNPAQQVAAQNLSDMLLGFGYANSTERGGAQTLLGLLGSPLEGQKTAGNKLLAMLNSSDSELNMAASGLLKLMANGDVQSALDAEKLSSMLLGSDPKEQQLAKTALSKLNCPKEIHAFVGLLEQAGAGKAVEKIAQMLGSPAEERQGRALLGLLTSDYEVERNDGQRLFALLQSAEPSDSKFALRVLNSVGDMEHRRAILNAWQNAELKPGIERVLDCAESTNRKDRLRGSELLNALSHKNNQESQTGEGILRLLGGDIRERALAGVMLDNFNSAQRREMLGMLQSENNKAGVERLVDYLTGTPQQRSAAEALLRVQGGLKTNLLNRLGEPDQEETVFLMLHHLTGPSQIAEMAKLLDDPRYKDAAQKMIGMLKDGERDYRNVSDVRTVLYMMGALDDAERPVPNFGKPQEVDTTNGERLLRLLSSENADDRQLAVQLLRVNDPVARNSLVTMLHDTKVPQNKELAHRLLKMLGGAEDGPLAADMLRTFSGPDAPAKMQKMIEILDNPNLKQAAAQLRLMSARDGGQLLELLASGNPDQRQAGEKLLDLLNDPNKDLIGAARKIMQSRLGWQEVDALHTLLTNPDSERSARALVDLVVGLNQGDTDLQAVLRTRDGVSSFLKRYYAADLKEKESTEPKEKEAARQDKKSCQTLFDMLAKPESRGVAQAILSNLTDPEQVKRMVEALENPRTRAGAEQLIKLMQPEGMSGKFAAVAEMLGSKDEATRRGAERLLAMLGDSEQVKAGKALIETARDPQSLKKLVEMIGKDDLTEGGRQALAQILFLAGSSGNGDRKALSNLVALIGSDLPAVRQVGERLAEMLSDHATKAQAKAVLSGLEQPAHCVRVMEMLQSPASAQAGKVLVDMLASGKEEQVSGVQSLFANSRLSIGSSLDRPERLEVEEMIARLGDPRTSELAKKALSCARSPEQLRLLNDMLNNPAYHKQIETMHAMSQSPEKQIYVQSMLSGLKQPDQLKEMLNIAGDPQRQKEFETLLELLSNDEFSEEVSTARAVLAMLSSPQREVSEAGAKVLKALGCPEVAKPLTKVLAAVGPNARLADFLCKPENKLALESLGDSISDNLFERDLGPLRNLAQHLNSSKEADRREGERILKMLSDPRHRLTGLRLLEQLQRPGGEVGR
jgi:hypothetical protein